MIIFEMLINFQVPKRLMDLVSEIKSKHQALKEKAFELSNDISQRVQDWECFRETLDSFSDWLEGAHAELKHISQYQLYLLCFQDILDRHKVMDLPSVYSNQKYMI